MDVKRIFYWGSLLVSCLGLFASLAVHIRSFFGIGLLHWVFPFGMIFCLCIPDWVARSDLAGNIDRFRQFKEWVQALYGNRPTWMTQLNWVLLGYFAFSTLILWAKDHSGTFSHVDSSQGIPAPAAQFFSTAWMSLCWEFICVFWLVLHPDSRHTPIHRVQ
jgi:hypothetical protein